MSGSLSRPTTAPVKAQLVESLMITPPSPARLQELLAKAASDAGWAAWAISGREIGAADPESELLAEAEAALFNAYLAVYAFRGGRPS